LPHTTHFGCHYPKAHCGILYYLQDRIFKVDDGETEFVGPKHSQRYLCFMRELERVPKPMQAAADPGSVSVTSVSANEGCNSKNTKEATVD
jgi:hypothetical protein